MLDLTEKEIVVVINEMIANYEERSIGKTKHVKDHFKSLIYNLKDVLIQIEKAKQKSNEIVFAES